MAFLEYYIGTTGPYLIDENDPRIALPNQMAQLKDLPVNRVPSDSVVDEVEFDITPAVGTALTYARGDHTHGTPPDPTLAYLTTVGNLSLFFFGPVAFAHDATTGERGYLLQVTNRTGHSSVKGELVSASSSADKEVVLQTGEFDTIGVIAQAGVAEGDPVWMWTQGSICQVLAKNSTNFTRGELLIAADTDGRADRTAAPSPGLPGIDTHFKECGHIMESKTGGTNVLVLCSIHMN